MNNRGFTLIELLISMAVLSIIAGLDVLLLQTGMESWNYAGSRLLLQQASDELMENLLEGGFDGEGIRDAVELTDAGLQSISFVPLWTDRSRRPDPIKNKQQKFILEKQFKPGASTPAGQIKKIDSNDFISMPIKFIYGEGRDPKKPDDVVIFTDPIPIGSDIKILYTPDGDNDPEVVKVFRFDPLAKRVYESYAGQTKDMIRRAKEAKVERCAFLYYDNLNRLLPMAKENRLSSFTLRRAVGVKLYLVLSQGSERKELTSFTNVRNVSTIGATVTEGAELPMPSPEEIKAFSIGTFYGFKKEGIVELVVKVDDRALWKIRMKFKKAANSVDMILESFRMESPPGKIVASALPAQALAENEFLSIQSLDRTGLYDYDDDEEVKDLVAITGANFTVTVTRLDFEGASLFIRP